MLEQAMYAQTKARMWVRNGTEHLNQHYNYVSSMRSKWVFYSSGRLVVS